MDDNIDKVTIPVSELERLRDIETLVKRLFRSAEESRLFVGMGYDARRPLDKQEGEGVKKLKKLVRYEDKRTGI